MNKYAKDKETVLVSVIVPAFNNAEYLREALESIQRQTMENFEVICVDDGSTDGSADIAREFADNDPRFRYVYQDHTGAGSARNTGMDYARGLYLSFLDGDDKYYPYFLARMIAAAEKTRSEICMCGREVFDSVSKSTLGSSLPLPDAVEGKAYPTEELMPEYLQFATMTCWDKLFERSLVLESGYRFQNIESSNDVCFVYSLLSVAKNFCFINEPLVLYRVGTGVSTQDRKSAYPLCGLQAYDAARENVLAYHANDAVWQRCIDCRCVQAVFNSLFSFSNAPNAFKMVYDAFHDNYEKKWGLKGKPICYLSSKKLALMYWCYRRSTVEKLMWASSFKNDSRAGEKKHSRYCFWLALLWAGIREKA